VLRVRVGLRGGAVHLEARTEAASGGVVAARPDTGEVVFEVGPHYDEGPVRARSHRRPEILVVRRQRADAELGPLGSAGMIVATREHADVLVADLVVDLL